MHLLFSMNSFKVMMFLVVFFTPLAISKIIVEAKDENRLSNQKTNVTVGMATTTEEYDYGDCPENDHQCEPGVCITSDKVCDGIDHCGNGSDEDDCPTDGDYDYECSDFDCGDGQCIELSRRCNGFDDCSDGRDEIDCNSTCSEDEIACGDKTCVSKDKACDGNRDCSDGTDENSCSVSSTVGTTTEEDIYTFYEDCTDKFQCEENECVEMDRICDGLEDCFNGADELNCHSTGSSSAITTRISFTTGGGSITASPVQSTTQSSVTCSPNSFHCSNGVCIDNAQVCDGFDHCNDNSDELSCPAGTSALLTAITKGSSTCQSQGIQITATPMWDANHNCVNCTDGTITSLPHSECSALSEKINLLMLVLLATLCLLYTS